MMTERKEGNRTIMEIRMDPNANPSAEIISQLVLAGDLSKLTPVQKVQYYNSMCQRLGLDPMTQPFKLLKLSGKEVMYCDRSGAQQLSKIHQVSHQRTGTERVEDVVVIYMRASLPDGRFTESSGAVTVGTLKGDALANALMKAETKAKRRATMDLLGLGMLDETEIETIPGAVPIPAPTAVEAHKDDKLKNEDYIMPIGRNKDKKFKDIPRADLESTVAWCKSHDKFLDLAEAITAYLGDTGLDFDQRPAEEVKEAAKSQPGASVEEIEPPQKPAGPQEVVDAKTGEILTPLAVNSHKLRSVLEQQIKFAKSKTSIESIKSRITKATEAGELLPTDAEHLTLLVNGKSHTIK